MQTIVEAVYEHGILRPLQALPLAEGSHVEVIVTTTEPADEGQTPAEILATIAALPLEAEPDSDAFSGQDHDQILYGDKGAR